MSNAEQTIEAEVVEIDGVTVEPRPAATHTKRSEWNSWGAWQGRVKKLDARWRPLWLVLGFIVLVLVVAVGMCAAIVWIGYKLVMGLAAGFLSLFVPNRQLQRR